MCIRDSLYILFDFLFKIQKKMIHYASSLLKNQRFKNLYSGFISGLISCAIVQPLEVIKTQIIVNPNKIPEIDNGNSFTQVYYAAKSIYQHKNGGLKNFTRGSLISSIRQGIGFGIYSILLENLNSITPASVPNYIKYTVNAFVGKSLALIICNPLVILKTRKELITNQTPSQTKFLTGIQTIIKEDGMIGLFKGANSMISREATFSIIHYNLYQYLKIKMPQNKFLPSFIAAMGAMCISQPFEVIRNRIQVPKKFQGGQERQYKGIVDGFNKIIKHEGASGLFKGFFIMFLKKPLNTTITWLSLIHI
eukprot:TRINITY_DN6665_c0_g1_i5.p1 TRINITY_DN6665_c0_g1~~TRINITY_DN6665_c0_g1_i5.p1  ORF type:complete len:308 (-),score=43.55 TRINITY_DN6665_c0_g1_i5:123-1046(-)